jgi:release factor glutamine methyltransferase
MTPTRTATLVSIKQATDEATRRLAGTVTETPRLDAEVLMAYVLGWARARLFAHWDEELPACAWQRYMRLVERRAAGEPVAYIRNLKEFLGLEFYVDRRVLIPRPETELLVARAVAWLDERLRNEPNPTVVDVGTGSGAVAVGIAKHVPGARLIATDLSAGALDVARLNAARHGVGIDFRHGSLLGPIDEPVDLIVANLPYLSGREYEGLLSTSIAYEPRQALTDGQDGLRLFTELFDQLPAKLAPSGCVLLEIGSGQPAPLQQLASDRLPGFRATVFADYAGLPRVLQGVLSPGSAAGD